MLAFAATTNVAIYSQVSFPFFFSCRTHVDHDRPVTSDTNGSPPASRPLDFVNIVIRDVRFIDWPGCVLISRATNLEIARVAIARRSYELL